VRLLFVDDDYRPVSRCPYLTVSCREGRIGPLEQPFGLRHSEVDAPVAAGPAKVVVPVGPVNSIRAVEIHYIRHVRLHIVRAHHRLGEQLVEDAKAALNRRRPCCARRYGGAEDFYFTLISD